jgi:hypothetical protein
MRPGYGGLTTILAVIVCAGEADFGLEYME